MSGVFTDDQPDSSFGEDCSSVQTGSVFSRRIGICFLRWTCDPRDGRPWNGPSWTSGSLRI